MGRKSKIIRVIILVGVIALCLKVRNYFRAKELFRTYIASPIPEEVKEIRLKEKQIFFSSYLIFLKFKLNKPDLFNELTKGLVSYEDFQETIENFKSRRILVTRDLKSKEWVFEYEESKADCGYARGFPSRPSTIWPGQKGAKVPKDVYSRIYDAEYDRQESICKMTGYRNVYESLVSKVLISKKKMQSLKLKNARFFYGRSPGVGKLLIFDVKENEVYYFYRIVGR